VTNAPLFQFKKVPEQVPKVAAPASAGRTFEAISFLLVSTSAYHIQVRPWRATRVWPGPCSLRPSKGLTTWI